MADGKLYSRSNLLFSMLTLFLLFKRIVVDPTEKNFTIYRQVLWLFSQKRSVDFGDVRKIDYNYSSLLTSWSFFFGTRDEVKWFTIKLKLYSGKRIKLWTFFGEGAVEMGWTGTIFGGDEAIDDAGTQEDESRNFVKLLEYFLEKPIV